jgi:hypothetical protein
MALIVDFTIEQSSDCKTITVTETTGDGAGGYGDAGNILYTSVANTNLIVVTPDGTARNVNKAYLPTQAASPNGSFDVVAEDLGYTIIPNGVYGMTLELYSIDTPSGGLVEGTKYIVTGGTVTYDGTTYAENETFVATAVDTYTENTPASVNVLEAKKECNLLITCGLLSCLKTLMLQRCEAPCDCRDDFHAAMNELIIDYNAAQLAFNEQNYKCANDTITRLEKNCSGICNDCGC